LLIGVVAKFQPLIMTAIPEIANLLIDSRWAVQETGAATLLKLSEQSKSAFQLSGPTLLISIIAEFRPLIANFLPQIIALLKDAHRSVRKAGADTLLKLSEQGERLNLSQFTCSSFTYPVLQLSSNPRLSKQSLK
jgi:hypothetical protein